MAVTPVFPLTIGLDWIHCLLNLLASCLWFSASFSQSACSSNLLRNCGLEVGTFCESFVSENVFILTSHLINNLDIEFEVEH